MEKKKQKEKAPSFDGGNPFSADTQHATICCGVYQERLPVAGKTIGDIRAEFGNQLEIADQAVATVSGVEQGNDYRVGANEIVLFIQQAGEKGIDEEWSGPQCDYDPDGCWIDDETGEHVNAATGQRTNSHPGDEE